MAGYFIIVPLTVIDTHAKNMPQSVFVNVFSTIYPNAISLKVGTLSKNAIKTKTCNLLNHMNFYLTDKSTDKTYPVFSRTNLIVFCKYEKRTECDTCNTLKKSWDKGKKMHKRLKAALFWKVPQIAI